MLEGGDPLLSVYLWKRRLIVIKLGGIERSGMGFGFRVRRYIVGWGNGPCCGEYVRWVGDLVVVVVVVLIALELQG